MKQDPPISYVTWLVNKLIALYIEAVDETDPMTTTLLAQKSKIQNSEMDNAARRKAYIKFWETLDEDQQLAISTHDAKINQLSRIARIMATTEVVWAHNTLKPSNAGSADFVISLFRKEGVTAKQLQKFIDENALAWFSLTGHPTNPTTVPYTKAQINIAAVLSDSSAKPDDLKDVLRALRDTPVIGPHKTPLEETQETLATLDVIYNSAIAMKELFEDVLRKHGYAQEGVEIRTPLIRPCVWTLGDGDGNENMTAKVLTDGIALHRQNAAAHYAKTCASIISQANEDSIADKITHDIEKLIHQIESDKIATAETISQSAKNIANQIPNTETANLLNNLAYLVQCFGRGFGKIDLRHNAVDIMATVRTLFNDCNLMDNARFSGLNLDEQSFILSSWLEDDEVLQILSKKPSEELEDETARRVVERLRVIGQNPDMCEKMIIAETTHPAHALAALLLLKITGNHIGDAQSNIDLVVLSESVADLVTIGKTLEILLENNSFRQHVASRKRLVVMIAKSDTTRQDGRGEAEYAQYEAAVEVYRIIDLMKRKYPEIEPVLVSIKNGGGHALQRGGGRITEIPAVHGRAAADARVTDIGPSTLTIQGQQQTILFCPGKTAIGTLEALAAQNLYTKAGIQGEMPPPQFSKNTNRQYARADAWLYAKTAGKAFDALVKDNPAIDELLVAAPWLSMKAGNVSSRPAKRGEKPIIPGITPAQAKGENPKALAGRAISGERLTAHACLPVFSVLGLVEAMEAVQNHGLTCMNPKKYGEALHHLYRAHKIHRDAARSTINAVAMANFDIAWPLLTGQERPSAQSVRKLAEKFVHSSKPHSNEPKTTLAFLEEYFLRAEKLTYQMVSGQKPKSTMRHGDALKKLWPDLSVQVGLRDMGAEFARVIECYRARQFDAAPDIALSEKSFRITQALYTSANVINAPVGILATRTRLEPVQEIGKGVKTRFMRPQSYQEEQIIHLLKKPSAL